VNLVSAILNHARTSPRAPALAEIDRTIDYGTLALAVTRTARRLSALGIGPGDRLGLCLKDDIDHIIAYLAVGYVGAAAVPIDWRARPEEIARITRALGLKRLIAEADAWLPPDSPAVALDAAWHRSVARAEPLMDSPATWQDVFTIAVSSGSTGTPKFVATTHLQYSFVVSGVLQALDLSGPHRFLCTLPLCYVSAPNRWVSHLLRGDCVVIHPSLVSAAEYIDIACRVGATVGVLVPTVVRQLLASAAKPPLLPAMAAVFTTGAPLSPEEKLAASRTLTPNFYDAYGTTEIGLLSLLRPRHLATHGGSVGQPHALADVQIVDVDDVPLPAGAAGRLRYRGPALGSPVAPLEGPAAPHGYHDGWHYPDEIAHLDLDGFLFLHGRNSDVINRGGAKFYPIEIENTLQAHEGVGEAAVLGRRQEGADDEVVAFVVVRGAPRLGELLAHCRGHLAAHKVPQRLCLVPSLPRTPSGKIDKAALRDRLARDAT
jgi:acyl-CoA synthetase (AMP-forming)/AMP-acid ligase II